MSLDAAHVEPMLRGSFGRPYVFVESCTSTQDLLHDSRLPEGAVAVADHQSGGRGRSGRTWEDTPGEALLLSLLLRPRPSPHLAQLALVAGHATAEAVSHATGLETALKWPNDVLLDDAKVAGILLEAHADTVVCGIGVNVLQPVARLPAGAMPAASLRTATGTSVERSALLVELLARLEDAYRSWQDDGLRQLLPALEARNWLRGRRVVAEGEHGVADTIAADGRLRVQLDAGGTLLAASGEVTLAVRAP